MSDTATDTPPPSELLKAIAEAMRELGYKAQVIPLPKGHAIASGTSGYKFGIFVYPADSVQFYLTMDNMAGLSLEDTSVFNQEYRYAKLYLSKDSDIVMEADFLIQTGAELQQSIQRCMEVWDPAVASLAEMLRSIRRRGGGESSPAP